MEQDKKLFFGVSEEDMAEQERAKKEHLERLAAEREQERLEMEKRQIALEEQKKQKKRANDLSVLFNKYCSNKAYYTMSTLHEYLLALPAALWLTWNIILTVGVFGGGKPYGWDLQTKNFGFKIEHADDKPNSKRVVKFHPNTLFYVNMSLIMLTVLAIIGNPKERIKNHKHNKNIKNEEAAIEMMYDLDELKEKYHFDMATIKKLLRVVPYIVSNMSKDKRVYFDMLMEGKIKIQDNKAYYDMAVAILAGHLESHPQDYAKLQAVFVDESIPQQLKQKYGYQR